MIDTIKRTFAFHMLFSAFNGIAFGVATSLQEVVAKKALCASDFQITILYISTQFANLISVFLSNIFVGKRRIEHILWAVGISRIVLAFSMLLVSSAWQFILALWIFQLPNAIINPAQNYIVAQNYSVELRGRKFGYSVSIANLTGMLAAIVCGKILDVDQALFRAIFFAISVCGGIGSILLGMIKTDDITVRDAISPFKQVLEIFKANPRFLRFESYYFLYGIAFLILGPVVPIYMVDCLNMSYTQVSIARSIIGQLGIVLIAPFAGRALDRTSIFTFSGKYFSILALFPLILIAANIFSSPSAIWAYLAFAFYAIAMAGISISWNLGSISFAERGRENIYQSVHLTLTGLRGVTSPFFGVVVMSFAGFLSTFGIAAVLLATAGMLMFAAGKNINTVAEPVETV